MERRVSRKLSRTVWSQGKAGDDLKGLPMAIYRHTEPERFVYGSKEIR